MCLKFGRECPGPIDAPLLFIDNSAYPSGKRPKKPKATPAAAVQEHHNALAQQQSQVRYLPSPEGSSPEQSTKGYDEELVQGIELDKLPYELAFDLTVNVSPRYVLHEAFYANLVRFFCADGRQLPGAPRRTPTWLNVLPRLAANQLVDKHGKENETKQALSLALRSVTAAFTGIETRNVSLLEYASRLYGAALRGQGKVLAADEGGKRVKGGLPEVEMLGTSVLLSMFEAIVATTSSAYAEHILGAAKMISRILKKMPKPAGTVHDQPRPHAPGGGSASLGKRVADGGKKRGSSAGAPYSQPLPTGLFFHVRFQLTFVYMATTSERLREDNIVMTVLEDACGWELENLPLMQRLLRPVTRLKTLLHNTNLSIWQRQWAYENVKEEVSQLWEEYQVASGTQKLRWTDGKTGRTDFRDPFTALTFAYFAACWVLLEMATPRENSDGTAVLPVRAHSAFNHSKATPPPALSTPSPSPSTSPSASASASPWSTPMADHHALILSVAWYLRLRDVGFSYLRLHTPLFVTAKYASSMEQRRLARMIFEEWNSGALRGIGALGLDGLEEGETTVT